jgi:ribosomal protein S18 acetylase RimI-like enzyme
MIYGRSASQRNLGKTMMPGPLIREARPEELEEIERLVREAYREFRGELPEKAWRAWMLNIGQAVRSGAGLLLVVVDQGKIQGAVKFYPDAAQSGMGKWPPGVAAIRILAVSPASRGRGYGLRLTEACLRRARELKIDAIFLYTGTFMRAARHLYEKLGFQRLPEFDGHPGPIAYRLDLV